MSTQLVHSVDAWTKTSGNEPKC